MTNEFVKLENALMRAGREMEYPATPAIAARVRVEITRETLPRASAPSRNWTRILVPLAAALLLALALLFVLPQTRDAVAEFFGLRNLRVIFFTPTPTAAPTATPNPSQTPHPTARPTVAPTAAPFTHCCETTLPDAQRRAKFNLMLPPNELPSQVYYLDIFNNGEQVVMKFGDPAKPRFVLYQMQRWIYQKILNGGFGKGFGPGTVVETTRVHNERALWFSGDAHVLVVLDESGNPVPGTERIVEGHVLAWETGDPHDGVLYRLETNAPLEEALKFAESLRVIEK